jgi:hypothetical protein
MRVNPILDWSYRDVWSFLLTCKVKYCSLYDQGYTSIGSIHDTVPNALLSDSSTGKSFRPAYMLTDGRLERAGRTKKTNHKMEMNSVASNGMNNIEGEQMISRAASIIVVGDEILFGTTEDKLGAALCKKLHAIGWRVSHVAVVRNEIDSVAEEVERCKSTDDMVFIFGGLGPLHSDVSLAGVAKAFGVRLHRLLMKSLRIILVNSWETITVVIEMRWHCCQKVLLNYCTTKSYHYHWYVL